MKWDFLIVALPIILVIVLVVGVMTGMIEHSKPSDSNDDNGAAAWYMSPANPISPLNLNFSGS